ncbi:TRAP transporter small permease subunit [Antarcticimicrobium luteum]|uniref:TRAP transporter small permease protein n=1 Tax=Antarcticimicrobium luteum TaxID=2547397 RepID=A0A4R5V1N4_9RHOB|nr:TRAP transporter small permease [Antarcticimicrobium luteum]TDK45672.1 TRAP transporter small permease [Antarcticimicrobium luteum]
MQSTYERQGGLVRRLAVWSNWLAALALALMMVHITIDVIMRYLFSAPLTGTIEIVSAYYMVAVIAFPLAYVHFKDHHIRVELFTAGLSSHRQRQIDTAVEVLLFVMFTGIAVLSIEEAVAKTQAKEVWEAGQGLIQVWPARWSLAIGFSLMALVSFSRLLSRFGLAGHQDETIK